MPRTLERAQSRFHEWLEHQRKRSWQEATVVPRRDTGNIVLTMLLIWCDRRLCSDKITEPCWSSIRRTVLIEISLRACERKRFRHCKIEEGSNWRSCLPWGPTWGTSADGIWRFNDPRPTRNRALNCSKLAGASPGGVWMARFAKGATGGKGPPRPVPRVTPLPDIVEAKGHGSWKGTEITRSR